MISNYCTDFRVMLLRTAEKTNVTLFLSFQTQNISFVKSVKNVLFSLSTHLCICPY